MAVLAKIVRLRNMIVHGGDDADMDMWHAHGLVEKFTRAMFPDGPLTLVMRDFAKADTSSLPARCPWGSHEYCEAAADRCNAAGGRGRFLRSSSCLLAPPSPLAGAPRPDALRGPCPPANPPHPRAASQACRGGMAGGCGDGGGGRKAQASNGHMPTLVQNGGPVRAGRARRPALRWRGEGSGEEKWRGLGADATGGPSAHPRRGRPRHILKFGRAPPPSVGS